MRQRETELFLQDIINSIDIIEKSKKDKSIDNFYADITLQDSIIRRLSIIGEAAKNIPENLRSNHPEVAWKAIIDTRNFVIHEYYDLDMDDIWNSITGSVLKILKQVIKEMLKSVREDKGI